MKTRILSGLVGALVAAVIFIYGNVSVTVAMGIIILLALYEFNVATGLFKEHKPMFAVSVLYALCIVYLVGTNYTLKYCVQSSIGFATFMLCYMVLRHDKIKFSDVATNVLGTMYITIFFAHIIMIRHLDHGKIYIWLVFIIAWFTDTFAYFCGKTFGKHKLIPNVSPKKTIEGSIGGVIGAAFSTALFCYICASYFKLNCDVPKVVVLAVIASVISQFGDLAASCIKREHNVKDFGNIMPGHGGVMDRFDSVLIIAPFVYYFVYYLGIIG